jgi:hypothetical protein
MNGLWGFCPVTVIAATDCGLAGSCVDQASCSSGCGQTGMKQLTTFAWYASFSSFINSCRPSLSQELLMIWLL